MWQSLGDLIPEHLKKSGIEKSVADALICEEFQKIAAHILGDAAEHCRAIYLKDRCLAIAVLSKAVSNELKLYEQDILRALANKFGEDKVANLRFIA